MIDSLNLILDPLDHKIIFVWSCFLDIKKGKKEKEEEEMSMTCL